MKTPLSNAFAAVCLSSVYAFHRSWRNTDHLDCSYSSLQTNRSAKKAEKI